MKEKEHVELTKSILDMISQKDMTWIIEPHLVRGEAILTLTSGSKQRVQIVVTLEPVPAQ